MEGLSVGNRNSSLSFKWSRNGHGRYNLDGSYNSKGAADRIFIHLPDPQLALSELVRVTTPGGLILLAEGDHETQVLDTPYPEVTRRFFHAIMWFITIGRKPG